MIIILLILTIFVVNGDDVIKDRVLICMAGSLRGGPLAWSSLKKRVLDYYKADLLVIGPDTQSEYAKPLISIATFVFEFPDRSDWGPYYDNIQKTPSPWRNINPAYAPYLQGMTLSLLKPHMSLLLRD